MGKRRRSTPLPSCYATPEDATIANDDGNCDGDDCPPYVEHHDGRRFWSDRFYLNATETTTSASTEAHHPRRCCDCDCGSSQAPPTFPLVDFVNQTVDAKAAVMGTFNLHPEWFRQAFPRFGGPRQGKKQEQGHNTDPSAASHTIPTFVLHGHRGLERALARRVEQADELDYETDREDSDNEELERSKSRPPNTADASSKFQFFLPATAKATEVARDFVDNPYLKLCQVHCNRESKHQPNSSSPRVSADKENGHTDSKQKATTATKRETTFGVHHPKFYLLFERSGDLVVIVTTANLTPTNPSTVEGSWVQRFRRCRKRENREGKSHSNQNDFGRVLQDFLVKLSEAAAAGAKQLSRRNGSTTTPLASHGEKRDSTSGNNKDRLPLEKFLSTHIGLTSLSEFSSMYHFEAARGYLVPIVPGEHRYDPDESSEKDSTRCYYGRQRVRYVLDNLATSAPRISKKTQDQSKSDRLMLQPTSLGSDWSRSQFASLVREYMGYYNNNGSGGGCSNQQPAQNGESAATPARSNKKQKPNHPYHRDDFWVCRQADIVWPSDRYMTGVGTSMPSLENGVALVSPLQAAAATTTRTKGEGTDSPARTEVMNSFIFNSSRTFNACDLEFVSRMAKFQPSQPCQFRPQFSDSRTHPDAPDSTHRPVPKFGPHFKSIARLFPNHVAMHKRDVPAADAYFSWFLLTSACLSLGAQGATVESDSNPQRPQNAKVGDSPTPSSVASTVSYRNFELGVLFVSHLPKKGKPRSKARRVSEVDSQPDLEHQRRSLVYCFHPHRCSCGDKSNNKSEERSFRAVERNPTLPPQLVHLPVPFNVRPESYFQKDDKTYEGDDEDDADTIMTENPFFHEISDGSRCVGNMLLTPFGQRESRQTHHCASRKIIE